MNKPFGFTSWSLRLSLFAALILALVVIGYRLTIIDFQPAVLGLVGGALAGLLAVFLGLIGTFNAIKGKEAEIASTMAGSTLGFLIVMPVLLTALASIGVPPIHDITTDLEYPPEFVAIKMLRTTAHNSLDRLEPQNLASLQEEGYPDLAPALINQSMDQVFEAAVSLVKKRGWEIVAVSAEEGRIEAIDTTRLMGFKDDVVIRVQAADNQTQVDMRSVSRVGKSDLGANANRIRHFLADLQKR